MAIISLDFFYNKKIIKKKAGKYCISDLDSYCFSGKTNASDLGQLDKKPKIEFYGYLTDLQKKIIEFKIFSTSKVQTESIKFFISQFFITKNGPSKKLKKITVNTLPQIEKKNKISIVGFFWFLHKQGDISGAFKDTCEKLESFYPELGKSLNQLPSKKNFQEIYDENTKITSFMRIIRKF
ncbi:hypothetical protein [Mesonia aestuariivivens]|uniref:Uncharacterized protein n=1 Tax=Mesonia aestuariivivens TaxID=2796128 RepID=A0ABS6W283_9FLAO|nr:hypothetical protein [Mesonia aestuariivivens]MBW2961960.1 hypothetical protein [Mesonia aestuariivivens]